MGAQNTGAASADCPSVAEVWASDSRNPYHYGSAKVMISPVTKIEFLPSPHETECGGYVDLYVTMLARIPSGSFAFCSLTFFLHVGANARYTLSTHVY